MSPYTMRVPRKCNAKCYQNRLVPVLKKKHVSFFQQNEIASAWISAVSGHIELTVMFFECAGCSANEV